MRRTQCASPALATSRTHASLNSPSPRRSTGPVPDAPSGATFGYLPYGSVVRGVKPHPEALEWDDAAVDAGASRCKGGPFLLFRVSIGHVEKKSRTHASGPRYQHGKWSRRPGAPTEPQTQIILSPLQGEARLVAISFVPVRGASDTQRLEGQRVRKRAFLRYCDVRRPRLGHAQLHETGASHRST